MGARGIARERDTLIFFFTLILHAVPLFYFRLVNVTLMGPYFIFTLTLLCLPRCVVIFLRTYPAVRRNFIFLRTYPAVPLCN